MFGQSGDSESASVCQDNVTIGTTVTKGFERHFHLAFCGTVLGPRTFGVRENEIIDGFAREETLHQLAGSEPAMRDSRKNTRKKEKRLD